MMLPNYKEARKRQKVDYKTIKYKIDNKYINSFNNKTYFIKTYGCQMNEHDSENISAMIEELGFKKIEDYEKADLVILNTCSIRENAHNKAFGMLGRLKHIKETKNSNLIIGLCGCMAQEEGVIDQILNDYRFVNFVFGTHNLYELPIILDKTIKEEKQVIEVYPKEKDLVELLNLGHFDGVGLDVFEKEPLDENSVLYKIKDQSKVILTPHVAWGSIEARKRLINEVYLNIQSFINGEERNIVNK